MLILIVLNIILLIIGICLVVSATMEDDIESAVFWFIAPLVSALFCRLSWQQIGWRLL